MAAVSPLSSTKSQTLWQRWSQDASHAFQDMYGNLILGDDAGQSAKLVVVVNATGSTSSAADGDDLPLHQRASFSNNKHNQTLQNLGVTFCEINGRAYVQTVEPKSRAAMAGVLVRDCVQYAAVLASEWRDPLGEDFDEIKKHALEREENGQRISYKELKGLLQTGILMEETKSTTGSEGLAGAGCLAPRSSVPTTIQVSNNSGGTALCGSLSPQQQSKLQQQKNNKNSTDSKSGGLPPPPPDPKPVVLVFRRTKQRPSMSLPIWPNYRLDDECDVACQILSSLATSPPQTSSNTSVQSNKSMLSYNAPEETVEAATIRAMIQNAVGLAFLRSNKLVLGVSVHAGSGIVIARLPDGTWSAPSAIGIAGMGLGLQLGIEVAHSILILQTKEALEHFQRGGSFTVGANVGAAVGGVGREAVGAASLSGVFCGQSDPLVMVKDDEYHADVHPPDAPSSVGVAPLVAYAKSQGLYVGLSLEGSRIHGRNDVNARTYQFDTRKAISANDLLTGKVAPPPEADKLYEALHQVEFTHELHSLPRPPKALWGRKAWYSSSDPLDFATLEDASSLNAFERAFREFLYGGVYVWRVKGRKRERRTLWLYVPEGSASLQLGFVSKLSNVEAKRTGSQELDDRRSVASEEVTLDSALVDNQSIMNPQGVRTHVELSRKNSVALTDIICMDQTPPKDLVLEKPEEARRVISLETAYNQVLFVAKSDQEAQVLMSGIRILLESETKRCGIRGGYGKHGESSLRGKQQRGANNSNKKGKRGRTSGYASSEAEDNDDMSASVMSVSDMPEGWRSWGRVPGRNFLRGQAAANDHGYPQYVHGQLLVRDIAKNVHLPLPLPLCRVLLLDSSSPVISQWEKDRGDLEFEKTPWTFPPATPRERDQYQSEHQLIASGSMCGAHRTISYHRPRHGQLVRLFETQIVDSDDSEKLAFQIHERMPRRGFSIKVKILLRSYDNECEATVLGEIRPVGKNMSNPEAVHKAFLLVIDELRERYGPDGNGLLSGFLNAVNTFKEDDLSPHINGSLSKMHGFGEEKKEQDNASVASNADSKSIKLEDMLKANANLGIPDVPEPKFLQDRTPSPMDVDKYRESYRKPKQAPMPSDTFDAPSTEPVMIEVKPLPKIRLSLMPSPREEDEFDLDEEGDPAPSPMNFDGSNNGSTKSKKSRKSWGKKRKSRKSSTA